MLSAKAASRAARRGARMFVAAVRAGHQLCESADFQLASTLPPAPDIPAADSPSHPKLLAPLVAAAEASATLIPPGLVPQHELDAILLKFKAVFHEIP